jgi:hypothetical protein
VVEAAGHRRTPVALVALAVVGQVATRAATVLQIWAAAVVVTTAAQAALAAAARLLCV